MSVREPLLCLDTNASIDIGARLNLSISLEEQVDDVHKALKNLYDDSLKKDIDKIYRERYDQLRGTSLFLDLVDGSSSTICIPKFVEIEHGRIRPYDDSLSKFPTEELTPDLHESSLDIFSKTELSLQDSLVLASAIGMRADALVSNDEDFKRAFRSGVGAHASAIMGKALLLVDHRLPMSGRQPRGLCEMLLESFHRHYRRHPSCGRPLWIGRRPDGSRYLAYEHPIPFKEQEFSRIVPPSHNVSIIDGNSWIDCKIESIAFLKKELPEGVTKESLEGIEEYHKSEKIEEKDRSIWSKSFKAPKEGKSGHVWLSFVLSEFPSSWDSWSETKGERRSKRHAPKDAVGFVESLDRRA